jgi:hypothetical protein
MMEEGGLVMSTHSQLPSTVTHTATLPVNLFYTVASATILLLRALVFTA